MSIKKKIFIKKDQKGFTLIELLVVIAIISLLSAVVYASLNSARNRSGDAAVQANITQLKAQAEIYYDGVGNISYGTPFALGTCDTAIGTAGTMFNNSTISRQITEAKTSSGQSLWTNIMCVSTASTGGDADSWAISIPFKSDPTTKNWCIDNFGSSKIIDAPLSGTKCP